MMHVQKYLLEFGVEKLKDEHCIKVREYSEAGLYVLNYDQILSSKSHPITVECRGLILDFNFNVVSRSFDRFFNIGEVPESQSHVNWNTASCYDKVDGSLIRLYFYKGSWEIATRGQAFAEGSVFDLRTTFRDLTLKSLDMTEEEFQSNSNLHLDKNLSYICEVTSMENRCVKNYVGYTLHYLSSRSNTTYEYFYDLGLAHMLSLSNLVSVPKKYIFSSPEACKEAAEALTGLDEGFVLYQNSVPVCKIKSSAYVAVHHIRGEGLSSKRIVELVITGEQEEYLAYFPEDRTHIEPYVQAETTLIKELHSTYEEIKGTIDQKEFAYFANKTAHPSVLFSARKLKQLTTEVWNEMKKEQKVKILMSVCSTLCNKN